MKLLIITCCLAAGLAIVMPRRSNAADETWTGEVSDSACGVHHEEAAEGAGNLSNRECTLACVRGGSRYVLVSSGKVLPIANQDVAGLAENAGRRVTVTGTFRNGALMVTKIDTAD